MRATKYCTLEALTFEDMDELIDSHENFGLQLRAVAQDMALPYLRGVQGAEESSRNLTIAQRRLSNLAGDATGDTWDEPNSPNTTAKGQLSRSPSDGRFKRLASKVGMLSNLFRGPSAAVLPRSATEDASPPPGNATATVGGGAAADLVSELAPEKKRSPLSPKRRQTPLSVGIRGCDEDVSVAAASARAIADGAPVTEL